MPSAVHKEGVLQTVPGKRGIKRLCRFNKEVGITASKEIEPVTGFFKCLELGIIICFGFVISDTDPIAQGTDITKNPG